MGTFFDKLSSVIRSDSWANSLTGLGILGRDKLQSHVPGSILKLDDITLSNLFHGDAIASRLVTKIVEDAMRQGAKIVAPEGVESDEVSREWDRLFAWRCLQEADIWGRLYGSGAIFLGANDGQETTAPLAEDNVTAVRFLTVLDGSEYMPATYYDDPLSPLHGEPETYRLVMRNTQGQIFDVHETRLILFGGEPTSRSIRQTLQYRDYSVLQRVTDALARFDSDWRSASAMMSDGSQGVLRMKGFADVVAGGSKEVFATRMELINLCRSVARIMPLDADEEEFQYVERSWAGVADLLDKTTVYLAACAGMPVTVLFGRSPSGLNATGESDRIGWYDTVQAHRDFVLAPRASRLLRIVCRSVGVDPEGWEIRFPALLQESDKDLAERKKITADTDAIYLAAEVLQPEEVALARYARGEWSDAAPSIDVESRSALLELDKKRYEEQQEDPSGARLLTPSGLAGVPPTPANPDGPAPSDAGAPPPAEPVANEAYNGAQMSAMMAIISAVALGDLPSESAVEMFLIGFPVSREQANRLVEPARKMAEEKKSEPAPEPPAMFGAPALAPAPAQDEGPPVPAPEGDEGEDVEIEIDTEEGA